MTSPTEQELTEAYAIIETKCPDSHKHLLWFMYKAALDKLRQSSFTSADTIIARCPKCGMPEVNPLIGWLCHEDSCVGKNKQTTAAKEKKCYCTTPLGEHLEGCDFYDERYDKRD